MEEARWLPPEIEEGNIEYKYRLTDLSDDQFNHRVTQMHWRLNEGGDEAIYKIGYRDNGQPIGISELELQSSLKALQRMADSNNCNMTVRKYLRGECGITAEVLIERKAHSKLLPENIHIAVVGAFGTGKSSLIGVLLSGQLDNGRGLARTQVVRHQHEILSGRTSSVSRHKLYFNSTGKVLNEGYEGNITVQTHLMSRCRSLSDLDILTEAKKTVTLVDLAGHEKYFKTTVYGLVSHAPQYTLLCLPASSSSPLRMTTEHLGIAFALNVPIVLVITKSEVASAYSLAKTVDYIKRILLSCKRQPVLIDSKEDIDTLMNGYGDNSGVQNTVHVPLFVTSSVSGRGMDLLQHLLFRLPSTEQGQEETKKHTEVAVLATYYPESNEDYMESDIMRRGRCGRLIVEGAVRHGTGVSPGDEMYFGPNLRGEFERVCVQSVHINRVPVDRATVGQSITANIVPVALSSGYLSTPLESSSSYSLGSVSTTTSRDGAQCCFQENDSEASDSSTPGDTYNTLASTTRQTKQGQFLLSICDPPPTSFMEFDADILILNHPNQIHLNYQPVVHIGVVRQTARLISIRKESAPQVCEDRDANSSPSVPCLGTGDRACCRFRFLYYPEYFDIGSAIVLREGRTRGIGKIIERYV